MKRKIILPTVLSILIGSYLGFLIFKQYKYNNNQTTFMESGSNVYFLQQGVYSDVNNIEENTIGISDYIYFKEDSQYKVYVGITTSEENASKISQIFNDKNFDIYVKEGNISDEAFVEKLKQYDQLIKETEDQNVILGILKQILNEYEQVVKNGE